MRRRSSRTASVSANNIGLYDNALFHTQVESLEWDEAKSRWLIRTNRGDAFTAQFIGMGTGPLHVPKLPGIAGIEQFKGHSFHTSRWDYDYTGGDPSGAPMDRLADKRVGIIGTGATSVQCVPHLARACKELYVFQRTPSSVDVRANAPIDPKWFSGIATPGWQQRWLENFTANQAGGNAEEDLVQDGWTDLSRRIRAKIMQLPREQRTPPNMLAAFEDSDFEKMEEIRVAGRRHRRRSRDRGKAQGLVSPALQAAVLPRRVSAGLQYARARIWSIPTARGSSGSPKMASSSRAGNTSSTASSTRRGLRSAPNIGGGPASI